MARVPTAATLTAVVPSPAPLSLEPIDGKTEDSPVCHANPYRVWPTAFHPCRET